MITGTVPPVMPAIWDTTIDYDESLGEFYARQDIDADLAVRGLLG